MNKDRLMQILVNPVVSEKSTVVADSSRQFVFRVLPDATKPEIRKAVEMMFEVKVNAVRVVNIKGKNKRFGKLMVVILISAVLPERVKPGKRFKAEELTWLL